MSILKFPLLQDSFLLKGCEVDNLQQRMMEIQNTYPRLPIRIAYVSHNATRHHFLCYELPSTDTALKIYEEEYFRTAGAGRIEDAILLDLLRTLRQTIKKSAWPLPKRLFATTELEKHKELRESIGMGDANFSAETFADRILNIGREARSGSPLERYLSCGKSLLEGYSDSSFHDLVEKALAFHRNTISGDCTNIEATECIRKLASGGNPGAFSAFILSLEQIACEIYGVITNAIYSELRTILDPMSLQYFHIYHSPSSLFAGRSLFYDPVLRSLILGKPKAVRDRVLTHLLRIDTSPEVSMRCLTAIRGMMDYYPSWEYGVRKVDAQQKRKRPVMLQEGFDVSEESDDPNIMQAEMDYLQVLPAYLIQNIRNTDDRKAILDVALNSTQGISRQKMTGLWRKYGETLNNIFQYWREHDSDLP